MLQSQSLPETLKSDSLIYDAIVTPPGSPYSRRYPIPRVHDNIIDDTIEKCTVSPSPLIFTFESQNGSPYSRRIPASEKRPRYVFFGLSHNRQSEMWFQFDQCTNDMPAHTQLYKALKNSSMSSIYFGCG